MTSRSAGLAVVLLVAGAWAVMAQRNAADEFRHETHAPLFPGSCTTCHAGLADASQPIWPAPATCAACHDGDVAPTVNWTPRSEPPASNVRFVHTEHLTATKDSVGCVDCHVEGNPKGEVHVSRAVQCVTCHEPGRGHLEVGDLECSTCHYPLAEVKRLTASDVARFPIPLSHQVPGFGMVGHADLAMVPRPGGGTIVNPSCATCHAQNFCMNCHVNAPEVPAIQALAKDERSLVHGFTFNAPPSHAIASFATTHRVEAQRDPAKCATCHTQPSCAACHVAPYPKAVQLMPMPSGDRAVGATVERLLPASHTAAFREGHASEASASPRACSTCHVREDCLACHRPENASPTGGGNYHPNSFLARHPAAAYARQVTCSDCHNAQQFCASCHLQSGIAGGNTLGGANYHDGKAAFFVGHGQAARQSLETCVSCHAERDCTTCHSAMGGRRFSPHGPGFDGARLQRRNPEMCIACHGRAIPTVNR